MIKTNCRLLVITLISILYITTPGCRSPREYFQQADQAAYDIIRQKRQATSGQSEAIHIERPSDLLRRKILINQNLPVSGAASLGSDKLQSLKYWPDNEYSPYIDDPNNPSFTLNGKLLQLDLATVLRVAAFNSMEFQTRKERVFETALDLDLQRDAYRNTFSGILNGTFQSDQSGDQAVNGMEYGASTGVTRKLKTGARFKSGHCGRSGQSADSRGYLLTGITHLTPSISIPLLRGSGEHIATESLTQAERNVVYALQEFERYKKKPSSSGS